MIKNEEKQLATSADHGIDLSNNGFMVVKTLEDAYKVSEIIAKSAFCPKAFAGKAGDVLVAIQMGAEVGLKPMQALQNIAVINGKPSLWGDAMLAVCRQSKQFEYITERYTESTETYTCIVKRRNEPEFIGTFSKNDALKAGLWNKEGVWKNYPKRMLQMRARGFALRDSFPDLLRGIITTEEASDYDHVKDYSQAVGDVVDVAPAEAILITVEQFSYIKDKIKATQSDELKIIEMLKIEKLEAMTLEQFDKIDKMLDKKIAKAKLEAEKEAEPEAVADNFFAGVEQ